ncbi:hypothetical protein ABT144_06070 [Streptomyces sp. NPDC002039]|uniref:hypothetical protein n=1 Tax=unclassified Streptomyces TaxID=2593676 RepID=UPI00332B6698
MKLTPFVENVRGEFLVAAEAAGGEALAVAERLASALDASVRLTLLGVLSAAADEVSRDLAPQAVEVRLRGLDPALVVTPTAGPRTAKAPQPQPQPESHPPAAEEDGAPARINFRPPEHLKARIEEAAGREGLSVNTWLVRAVTATLGGPPRPEGPPAQEGQYNVGWVR